MDNPFQIKPTRMNFQGDKELAASHAGDAKRMLFQLKNIQRTNNSTQELTKRYEDGTVINVHSKVSGMDVVNIFSSGGGEKKEEKYEENTFDFPVPFIPVADDIEATKPTGVYAAKFFYGFRKEYVEKKDRDDESVTDYIIKYEYKSLSSIEKVKLEELDEVGVVDDWDYTDQTETESASYEKFPDIPIEDQDECPSFLRWLYLGGKIGIGTGFYDDYTYYMTEGEELRPWAWYSYGGIDCTGSDEGEWSASYDYSLSDAFIVNNTTETRSSYRIIHGSGDGEFSVSEDHSQIDYTIHNNHDINYVWSDLWGTVVDNDITKSFCYMYSEDSQIGSRNEELTGTVIPGVVYPFLRTPFCMGARTLLPENTIPTVPTTVFKTSFNEYILHTSGTRDADCKMFNYKGYPIFYYRAIFRVPPDTADDEEFIMEYGYEYKDKLFRIRFAAVYVSTLETEKDHSFYYHKFDTATVILPDGVEKEIDFSGNKDLSDKVGMYMEYDDDFRLKFGKYTIKKEIINGRY